MYKVSEHGKILCHTFTLFNIFQIHWHSGYSGEFNVGKNKLFRLRGIYLFKYTIPFFYYCV